MHSKCRAMYKLMYRAMYKLMYMAMYKLMYMAMYKLMYKLMYRAMYKLMYKLMLCAPTLGTRRGDHVALVLLLFSPLDPGHVYSGHGSHVF